MSESAPGGKPPAGPTAAPSSTDNADKMRLFRWFFFGVFAFLLYQLLLMLSLFAIVIFWAASLTLVFWPAWSMVRRRLPGRETGAALLFTVGILLLVLLPILLLFWVMMAQSVHLYPTVSHWITDINDKLHGDASGLLPASLQARWDEMHAYMQSNPFLARFDPRQFLLDNIDALSASLSNFGTSIARNILLGIVNLGLILVLMFFCFLDGERFLHWLFSVIPMPREQTEAVAMRIYRTITAVIRGALFTMAAQAVLAIIGYLIAGVPLAVLFGVLTGLASMIPVVGGSIIWLPLGLFVMSTSPGWGVFVLVWGLVFVSLADNVIKALFIGKEVDMPMLLIFCGMLGGANVYGFTGLIAGPILIAVLMAFISIYREQYLGRSK